MINLLAGVHLLLNHGNRLREIQPRAVEDLIGLLDAATHVERNACARDTDAVQSHGTRGMPVHHGERHNVLHEL